MIAIAESKKLICPSCGGSALRHAEQAAQLFEKHRRLGHTDAARRAESHLLHYWQAAIDYSGHDRAFQGRLAGSLRAYQRTQSIPDFTALQWGVRRELIIPPRGVRIDNKAWIKNGKVLMRDGKVLLCDECPCGKGVPLVECGTDFCPNGVPRYLKTTMPSGWTAGCSSRCSNLDGANWYWSYHSTSSGCCRWEVAKRTMSDGTVFNSTNFPGDPTDSCTAVGGFDLVTLCPISGDDWAWIVPLTNQGTWRKDYTAPFNCGTLSDSFPRVVQVFNPCRTPSAAIQVEAIAAIP